MHFELEFVIQFLLAALWGSIVGAEREYRGKAAGFRTTIMISIGACFFTIMSIQLGSPSSADRIAANIVTGIGFLGAGVIFRGENRVNGITTAATIWAVAAVGMGIGGGFYFASSCAGVLILIVLAVLPYFETYIDRINQSKIYIIRCSFHEDVKERYEKLFSSYGLKITMLKQVKDTNQITISWQVRGNRKNQEAIAKEIIKDRDVIRFELAP